MRSSIAPLFFTSLTSLVAFACAGGSDAPSDDAGAATAGAGGSGAGAAGAAGKASSGNGGSGGSAGQGGSTAGAAQGGAAGIGGAAGAAGTSGAAGTAGAAGSSGAAGTGGATGTSGNGGAAGNSGAGGAGAPKSGGLIVMVSIPPNAALPDGRGLVTASFFEDQIDLCERETVGACTWSRCPTPPSGPPATPPPDAGDVTVETGVKFAQLSPGTGVDPNTYASFTSSSVLYYGGESVKVAAVGAKVPAWKTVVDAPDPVTFSKPYTMNGSTLTLDSAKDYVSEWSSTLDDVRFGVTMKESVAGESFDVELSCTFDGTKGTGNVPQALLAKMPKKLGALSLSARNQVVVTAGKFDVTVRALAPAYGPTGASITSDVVVK